ncbi:MAG: thioredoxin-disulfide reductase [Clostridia bacterium]|nr:thioredoxin-disulfide reductase [Clostridia bacterium]
MYDIVIIGAGTAGLTAAIYGRRAEKSVLVLEGNSYGGQIINTPSIENYPAEMGISGFDFATKIYNQAVGLGAQIKFEKVLSIENGTIKKIKTASNEYESKTLIIATGSKNRLLGIENEKEFTGKGVSYCATCDGAFYKKKKVAVVGGGNTALEDAIYLSAIAEKVYLIHRRNEFRADETLVKQIQEKTNVEIILNSNVTALFGENKLNSIEITENSGKIQKINIDGLFVAVGRVPENEIYSNVVELDSAGYIVAGETCETSASGIFAAGDCRTKEVRQLVTAASDGAVASNAAIKFLNSH